MRGDTRKGERKVAAEPTQLSGRSEPGLSPLLVDEREARHLLGGLCAKTMYNLRKSSQIPSVKIGARIMYDPADLRAFVQRQKGCGHE
jgi:hypothetical protein